MEGDEDYMMEIDFGDFSDADKLTFRLGPDLNDQWRQMKPKVRGVLQKSTSILSERKERIKSTVNAPPFLRAIDKVSFVLGVAFMLATEYVLLVMPQKMSNWYLLTIIPLMIIRFILYRRQKFHYFMLDFCYFAQGIMTFNVLFYPKSTILFKLVFCLTNGPLLMGIVMWSNSLVFHDVDKITSTAIHYLPPLLTYCRRWYPVYEGVACPRGDCHLPISEALYLSVYFYLFWQISYLAKTEVVDRKKLQRDQDIITSARWMTSRKPHPLYVYCCKNKDKSAVYAFFAEHGWALLSLVQIVYTVVCITPMTLVYSSQAAHTWLLLGVLTFCTWNGANYYFEVFSKSYQARLGKILASRKEKMAEKEKKEKTAEKDD